MNDVVKNEVLIPRVLIYHQKTIGQAALKSLGHVNLL